jgi:hypothetical protein
MGYLPVSKLLFECRMDKYEIRRQNLRALIDRCCGGRSATLADLIERTPSYVSRMLYPEGKEGKKRIGEDMRDLIEDALSLKRGTLDKDPATSDEAVSGADASEVGLANAPSMNEELPVARAETTLERLDASEKSILELYRRSTDEGKLAIRRVASTVPKSDD